MRSEADLAADRDGVAQDANPFGCLELTERPLDRHVRASFPSCRRSSPASYGPIFEVRTYLLKPTGLPPTIAAWEKQAPVRMKLSPILAAMYSVTGEVTRFMHIWPYPDLVTRATDAENRNRNRRLAAARRTGPAAHDAHRHLSSGRILPYSLG